MNYKSIHTSSYRAFYLCPVIAANFAMKPFDSLQIALNAFTSRRSTFRPDRIISFQDYFIYPASRTITSLVYRNIENPK